MRVLRVDKNSKQKVIIGIVIVIAAVLAASAVLVYLGYFEKEEHVEKTTIPKEIDDRVSPLENQGLILEINRVRNRGLLDKLMTPGISWREKPTFYFIITIDDEEFDSSTEQVLFTGWDSISQEDKVVHDTPEEQAKSNVKIVLMERVKRGLLGRKYTDIERDTIQLTYDYRTGRWTGDDFFDDNDGYGHYVGEYFEVWFNVYQTDYDHDYIPYWTEVNILGTDPMVDDSKLDPDNDGIPTTWEWKWGYDPFVWNDHAQLDPDIDGIYNTQEYQMAKWFANPFKQDIYIEVDFMKGTSLFLGGRFDLPRILGGEVAQRLIGKLTGSVIGQWLFDPPHICWEESQQAVMERFCQHGINVYFDAGGWPDSPKNGGGEFVEHEERLSQESGMMLRYYRHHFPDERKGIFRYLLIGHGAGYNHPSEFNKYDTMHIFTGMPKNLIRRLIMAKGITPRIVQRFMLAANIIHELGHTMGISPWTIEGCDNISYASGGEAAKKYKETWGNYYSVMNYYYTYDHKLLDYSDGSNGPPYDQNDWEELYLPTFKMEAPAIEGPYFEPPGKDKLEFESEEFKLEGWQYDKNLTQSYLDNTSVVSPIDPIKCDFRVYVKTDNFTSSDDMNLRVYVKPVYKTTIIPDFAWSLIKEGYLDEAGNIRFYSMEEIIKNLES